ncbi:MAG: YbaK/prolyl-tRNA synthetase associated region [Gammaproteobacteria bacterium]|nr:YbaK/prolyl-tRNA synthetase associated region [Gammaproteobacteria bacterium]
MPVKRLKDFLDNENVKYATIQHSRAYTVQQTAEYAHISGKELAKTVMVKIDGEIAMAVLPAPEHVDLNLLKGAANAHTVEIAGEQEFKDLFPQCEIGAMPPFGNIYGMDVYVEEALTKDEMIAFKAGSHVELIELAYKDFERLVKPRIVRLSTKYSVATA